MYPSRRRLLVTSLSGVAAFFLGSGTTAAQDVATPIQNPPVRTNSRRDGPEDPENGLPAAATKKAILEQHQKDIKSEVEKLYDLATQLKTEVDKTDATSVLSLAMRAYRLATT